ncbi:MAG TPA: RagB/SusD family nutrient uptake outer membrane protein [Puia sp.]|nr:RagB/SusD family nutrient uptake outer membrane protein [Puia sp.]
MQNQKYKGWHMIISSEKYRRWYGILSFALTLLFFSSCHKFLDVLPTNAVSDDQAITDSASATNAVRGAYRALAAGGYYGATYQFDALLSGNALNYTQSGASQLQFLYHTLTADNNDLETIWAAAYAAINDANFVIAKVPDIAGTTLSQSYKNQLLGEAYFIRALAYFDLGRAFGGVQLFLTPTSKVSDKLGKLRGSQADTYVQVLADLNTAETLLPATTIRDRATQRTVWALRARLQTYLRQWPQAETDAGRIIADSADYKLVNPYSAFFNQVNTTESVFELSYSLAYPNPMYGNWKKGGNYTPNTAIVTLLQNPSIGGNRSALLLPSGTSILGNLYPLSNGTNPVYVIRVAELWLIRAEARAQQNNLSGALSDLNAIRTRAGLPNSSAVTQPDILLAIENERRVEFALEPQRWFDLVRTGRAPAVLNVTDPNHYLFPIPAPELSADHSLTQNPGY